MGSINPRISPVSGSTFPAVFLYFASIPRPPPFPGRISGCPRMAAGRRISAPERDLGWLEGLFLAVWGCLDAMRRGAGLTTLVKSVHAFFQVCFDGTPEASIPCPVVRGFVLCAVDYRVVKYLRGLESPPGPNESSTYRAKRLNMIAEFLRPPGSCFSGRRNESNKVSAELSRHGPTLRDRL